MGVAGRELTFGRFSLDGSSFVNVPWRFNSFGHFSAFAATVLVGLFLVATCFNFEMNPVEDNDFL